METDYTYCSDWRETCPKSCFRAEITENLQKEREKHIGVPLSYACFRGTDECGLSHGDIIRGMTDEELARLLYCIHRDARAVCYFGEQRRYMYPCNGRDWLEWVKRSGRYSWKGE